MGTRTRGRAARCLAGACALTLSSCATYYDARFEPAPLEVKIESEQTPGLLARALATVRGVRRPSSENPAAQVEVALRLENVGAAPFAVVPESFELVTADLQVLGPGQTSGAVDAPLAPGAAEQFELVFPLPAERSYRDFDFSGLIVRWSLRVGDATVTTSAKFERRAMQNVPYYYGGYWAGPGFWRFYPRVGAFCAY